MDRHRLSRSGARLGAVTLRRTDDEVAGRLRSRSGARLGAVTLALLAVAGPAWAQGATGQADFTRYVALGDSLTAAFASGGLLEEVQENSYPALLHRQARGGGDFEQPTVSLPGIPPLLDLVSLSPLRIAPRAPQSQAGTPTNLFFGQPYNNMAVPGFRVGDVRRTVTGNPIIDLVLRGNGTQLQQALARQPTFATLWIGNNDVLGAATSGIVLEGVTLTPVAQFEADFRAIVAALRGAGARLAIANIPDVTTIPFVTTIPPVVVNPATNQPLLVNGRPVPLIGPNGPLSANDFVLLSASAPLSQGIGIPSAIPGGTNQPLGDQFVLSASEAAAISARVADYNRLIGAVAQEAGAALMDIFTLFGGIARDGLSIGGIDYSEDFLTGGFFSYDGVHPTPFGYAFAANAFIEAINRQYGASIPPVDLFPFTFGSPGTAGTAGTVSSAEAKRALFVPAAYDSLRRSLRVPPAHVLLELQRQRQQDEAPGEAPEAGDPPARPERPARQQE
jgi:lysophospholipase L1-like esterase